MYSSDQAQLAVPVQRVADHPGGQLDGQGADLVAELADGLVALGPDGLPGPVELPAGVGLGLAAQVPADPLGVGPGLLQDPLGLVLGVTQPPPVLLQQLLGLLPVPLGLLELALDVGPAVLVRLVDRGEDRPVHEEQQDQEHDRAPDQLVGGGQDGIRGRLTAGADQKQHKEQAGTVTAPTLPPHFHGAPPSSRTLGVSVSTAQGRGRLRCPSAALGPTSLRRLADPQRPPLEHHD
jgi:hypothetical protein